MSPSLFAQAPSSGIPNLTERCGGKQGDELNICLKQEFLNSMYRLSLPIEMEKTISLEGRDNNCDEFRTLIEVTVVYSPTSIISNNCASAIDTAMLRENNQAEKLLEKLPYINSFKVVGSDGCSVHWPTDSTNRDFVVARCIEAIQNEFSF